MFPYIQKSEHDKLASFLDSRGFEGYLELATYPDWRISTVMFKLADDLAAVYKLNVAILTSYMCGDMVRPGIGDY